MTSWEILDVVEALGYTGFNDLAVLDDGSWISPASEARGEAWDGAVIFVWSGPDGYKRRSSYDHAA